MHGNMGITLETPVCTSIFLDFSPTRGQIEKVENHRPRVLREITKYKHNTRHICTIDTTNISYINALLITGITPLPPAVEP